MDKIRRDTKQNKRFRRWRYFKIKALRKLRRFAPHHSLHWVLIAGIVLPSLFVNGCDLVGNKNKAKPAPAVPVLTAAVVKKNIPIYLSALGNVTPIKTVTVRTQINGQLLRVHFADGQLVNAGEMLAEIDPRPYEALLHQYEGQLLRDKALLANARIDLERYTKLYEQDSVSQQTMETQKYLVKQYEGAIKFDQGQIDTVRVNLMYCKIMAPITGRLGLIEVDPGNFVQTSDTNGIVVINSMSPIYVDFTIPEDNLPQVAEKLAAGNKLLSIAQDRAQQKTLTTGVLLTTDNQIDTSTGTITLRALFTNDDHILFPNQFVNIQLLVDVAENATVVPTAAIQYGVAGTYVYVVNADQTVSIKPVKIITSLDDSTAVIAEIEPGQNVVTQGTDKLKEGTLVTVASPQAKQGSA